MIVVAVRYHDISCGHRVAGHESKCALMHGHNYRVTFTCKAEKLDRVGRVMDFSAIKSRLCMWLEDNWDHKFLVWQDDDVVRSIFRTVPGLKEGTISPESKLLWDSLVWVPFNPTAENMAKHLLEVIGPLQLQGTGVILEMVKVEETRKCSAVAAL